MPCPAGVNIPRNFAMWNEYHIYENKNDAKWGWTKEIPESEKAKNCSSQSDAEKPAAPKISIIQSAGTIQVKWEAVEGALSYNIYRDNNLIKPNCGDTYFKDSNLTNATQYSYCVTAVNDSGESDKSNNVKGMALVAKPSIIRVNYINNTYTIIWNKVDGADGYDIVWESGSGVITKSVDGENTTTASYSSSEAGSNPKNFKVRAKRNYNGTIYSKYSDTVNATNIVAPTLKSVKISSDKATIEWLSAAGATRYMVYYYSNDISKTFLASTTNTTADINISFNSGTEYKFYVVAQYSDGTLSNN